MQAPMRGRAVVKFLFWTVVAVGFVLTVFRSYSSGQMAGWYYHTAAKDGYAVNANNFMDATEDSPALLQIGQFSRIDGLQAVPVHKGDLLPADTNGVISQEEVDRGQRVVLAGDRLVVLVPWQIQESKGFKFKDTFKHKGIKTYPWAGVWNVFMTLGLGLSLGYMAEGFTDMLGLKLEKIRHYEGH